MYSDDSSIIKRKPVGFLTSPSASDTHNRAAPSALHDKTNLKLRKDQAGAQAPFSSERKRMRIMKDDPYFFETGEGTGE